MDGNLESIIKELAEIQNIPIVKVEEIVKNSFAWLRRSMMNLEYSKYYLYKLGTFQLNTKRYMKYEEARKAKRKLKNANKSNDNTNNK